MLAGRLDRRVTLMRQGAPTDDGYTTQPGAWAPLATVWASKQDVRDAERVQAQQVGASITTRFQIRYSSQVADLSPRDHLTCEGRTYAISAVKEIGRREGLEITATAQADTP